MRSSLFSLACGITLIGCSGSASEPEQTSPSPSSSLPSGNDAPAPTTGGTATPAPTSTGGMTTPPPAAPTYACTAAGIAAYADALVDATRKSCISDGVGAVRKDNYQCAKTAIDATAPPHPDAAYNIVTTLLAPNDEYPNLECTYFIQMVTSAICDAPLSPKNMAWQDYPLAYEFINEAPAGWTWYPNNGSTPVQVGDIFVYNKTNNQDPGHIMIVAEITGSNFRIAEANELKSDGSEAFDETGVMSNTRITSLTDSQRPAGWFRLSP